jgi:hypothetical protein
MVDTKSEHYVVAREYMVRLGRRDLSDRATARKLADAAGTELEDFVTRFSPAVESDTAERTRVRASA